MTFKKSTLALMMASTVALTGCLSDDYDYSGDAESLTAQVPLYHNDPKDHTSPYTMTAVDAHGMEVDVDGQENGALDNIQVTGDFYDVKPLTVEVSDDKASLVFKANQEYDINAANNSADDQGGTVQFYVQTKHYDIGEGEERNKVMLTMGNGNNTHSIDITSAMAAAAVTETGTAQWIRVPLSCFVEQGLDLGGVDFAMGIESEGAIEYEFSQARLASNSVPEQPGAQEVQGCLSNNNSKVLIDSTTIINQDIRTDGAWAIQGEADDVRITRGKGINPNPGNNTDEGTIRYKGIEYDEKFDSTRRSILAFAINKASELKDMTVPRLDMSHYMANGELQMTLLLPSTHLPAGDDTYLVLTLDTPVNNTIGLPNGGYPTSQTVSYNLTQAGVVNGEAHHVKISLHDFFVKPNGTTSLNGLQYVEKLTTHIEQRATEDGEADFTNLAGFKYGLADIKLVMNPDAE
ncbi:putative glycoside hydrolase [Photobacterium minamisatsumaniensis]|uniref:putative glycoside hydrolase n=1 Tax=Photobacterium minamisatsumaniensis TaxID=2910233 RepID=UPI003D0A3C71